MFSIPDRHLPVRSLQGLPVPSIKLAYASQQALNERLYVNGRLGGLTIDGEPPAELGERVQLLIAIERPRREFAVVAQVAWARRKASKSLGFSYGVDFVSEQGGMAERLVAFARNEVGEYSMRHQARVFFDLKVTVGYGGLARVEHVADLSIDGAFIRTSWSIEQDEVVSVKMRFPGDLLTTKFQARVAWSRAQGSDAGMGLEFIDHDGNLRIKLEKLLSKRKAID